MNPGLPGLGIGGLFYLISALAMPLVALSRQLRGEPARWHLALLQFLLAAGIFGSMAVVFGLLDVVLGPNIIAITGTAGELITAVSGKRVSLMMLTLAVLILVLSLMQITRLTLNLHSAAQRRRLPARVAFRESRTSARPATIGAE